MTASTISPCALLVGLLAAVPPVAEPGPPVAPASERPNLLLVVADDLGTDHLSWHPVGAATGHPAPTPVLASLARRGISFTQAYSTPICGPARASLLTGRYPFRHGLGDNPIQGESALALSELTLAEVLREHGYRTAAFGKWHLSFGRDDPRQQGFEHFDGTVAGLKGTGYYDWPRFVDGQGSTEPAYNTSVTATSAAEWIRARELEGGEPWFAYVAFSAPHKPIQPPPPELDPITRATSGSTELETYHGIIEALDTELGRLLQAVDLERTLLVFLGDNGTATSLVQPPEWQRKAKYTVYEGGILVPAFVVGATVDVPAGPERTRPGLVHPGLVHVVDFFQTLLDAAGVPAPEVPLDSVSLLPQGVPPAERWHSRRQFLFTERFEPAGAPPEGPFAELRRSIRDARHKLIRIDDRLELYDLLRDPWESTDLLRGEPSPEVQAARRTLEAELDALLES